MSRDKSEHDLTMLEMESLGLILSIFGAVFAFATAMVLALTKVDQDDSPKWVWMDLFLFGSVILFIKGLSKGISDAFYDRSSGTFLLVVIFIVSVLVTALGIWLMP